MFANLQHLLDLEYEHEKAEYAMMTETMGVERMVARGLACHPVMLGKSYYNSVNQFVVELMLPNNDDEEGNDDERAFEYGKQVQFFSVANGEIKSYPFAATVSYCDHARMVVALPNTEALTKITSVESLGVRLALDETSYRAMREALVAVAAAKGNRLAYLRDVMCGAVKPQFRDMPPMSFPWLNRSQQYAVNKALNCRDVMIVHGPPGTGKTTTLVEAICETINREPQVLVCAQSNTAIDWISHTLTQRGVPVLRIGNPSRVTDEMLAFTYERQFENHDSYPELWAIRKTIRELRGAGKKKSRSERDALHNRMRNLQRRADELEIRINAELFDHNRVIASTLVSCTQRVLYGRNFTTLFIDEAGQALEPACWIAIRKAHRVILAGDHCQLPPTVKCQDALHKGLGKTLMERVVERWRECVTLLTVQYRMHKDIMRFPSQWFYHGRLEAAPEVCHRSILDLDTPMVWIDTSEMDFREKTIATTQGKINAQEGDFFIEEVEKYVNRIGIQRILDERIDFGLISPYKAQVNYLRHKVKKSAALRHIRRLVSVQTIDGFQGQERDVVFISLVRSNDDGTIGFLSDLRRMNVAITRARMKLVIIGNAATLTRHPFYRQLFQACFNPD